MPLLVTSMSPCYLKYVESISPKSKLRNHISRLQMQGFNNNIQNVLTKMKPVISVDKNGGE